MMRPRVPLDPGSITGATDDEVLRRFVESVRSWRGRRSIGSGFRREDLAVLARILGSDARDVEARLVALTGCDQATARQIRRLLLRSLAAASIVTVAIGAAPTEPPAVVLAAAPAPRVAVTVPVVVSVSDVVVPEAVVPDVAVPDVAVPDVAVPEVAGPPPVTVAPGAEATVAIPRLGIELPVVGGGQDVIDDGAVAHYWAPGWREPAAAGAAGTYWLAAHHETHGSPFLRLPEVVVGDQVEVATPMRTFTYTVTSTEVVLDDAGFGPVYGDDPAAPVILLQTCLDDVRRLLVHGELTASA